MKKIYLTLIIIITILSFNSCNKDISNSQPQNEILKSLLQENLITNMINEVRQYNITVNEHNIMVFKKPQDIDKVIDILQKYVDLFDEQIDTTQSYPKDPVLYAFEQYFNFSSLRAHLEDEVNNLDRKDLLTELNNPDNHHVVSDVMRTILTPKCEIKAGALICVIYEELGVAVMNDSYYDLSLLHHTVEHAEDTTDVILSLCAERPLLFVLQNDPNVKNTVDFTFTLSNPSNTLSYIFTAHVQSQYSNLSYIWSINHVPVHYSNTTTFSHTFDSGGEKNITLEVRSGGETIGSVTKTINVGSCNANFRFDHVNSTYSFHTNCSSIGGNITNYYWDFGDGLTSTAQNPTHTYSSNGTYTVTLNIVVNSTNCHASCSKTVNVSGTGSCCKANDYENDYYSYSNRTIKFSARTTNIWPFIHRIASSTKYYEIKSNGSLKPKKADYITTRIFGKIYTEDCNLLCPIEYNKGKQNKHNVSLDHGFGYNKKYRVQRHSVQSSYYVQKATFTHSGTGVKLHNKSCF